MPGGATPLSGDTFPASPSPVLHYLKGDEGTQYGLPIGQAVYAPVERWPAYAFDVREACGIRWNWFDIRRFLDKCVKRGNCLIWNGAKSRGQGNTQWYGSFHTQGKTVRAHKFYGVAVLGLRPGPHEELDHECNDSLCVHVRVLTKEANRARIRRPTKQVLDLARFCDMSPAEVMLIPPERLPSLVKLMEVAKSLERRCVPPGVIVTRERRKQRKRQ